MIKVVAEESSVGASLLHMYEKSLGVFGMTQVPLAKQNSLTLQAYGAL